MRSLIIQILSTLNWIFIFIQKNLFVVENVEIFMINKDNLVYLGPLGARRFGTCTFRDLTINTFRDLRPTIRDLCQHVSGPRLNF